MVHILEKQAKNIISKLIYWKNLPGKLEIAEMELNNLKEELEDSKRQIKDFISVENEYLDFKKEMKRLQEKSLPPSVLDANYWNNKWKKSKVYYSAPKRLLATSYLKRKESKEIKDIADLIIDKNNITAEKVNEVPLYVMKWLESRFKSKKYKYKSELSEKWNTPSETLKLGVGDCFPKDTLVLRSNGELEQIKNLEIGDTIIGGEGRPVRVNNYWDRGKKRIIEITLNDHQKVRLSETHKVLTYPTKGYCRSKKLFEKRVKDLSIGEYLPFPDRLQFDETISYPKDTAYLYGLYLADGWLKHNQVFIAGKDGKKKQKQKKWVKSYCKKHNLDYEMKDRWIIIKNKKLASEIRNLFGEGCNGKLIKKHNLDPNTAKKILEGWEADATKRVNELTYSTVNYNLAVSLRILWRCCGYQVSIRKISNHGGFGKRPIYRIGVKRKKTNQPRIVSLKYVGDEDCCDISTSDGLVYLPEQDVIVRQCDDWGILEYNIIREIFLMLGVWQKHKHRLKCVVGNVNLYGPIPSSAGGHFYLMWLHDDREWRVVESTYFRPRAILSYHSKPMKFNSAYGTIWFTITEDHSFAQNSISVSKKHF